MIEQKQILQNVEFWEQLIHTLHFLDIRILEHVYLRDSGASYFAALEKTMGKMNVRRTAIRSHVTKLETLGLIKTIRSGILVVNSVPEISENVGKLITLCKLRWQG
ncbi:MAG: hypothetical protein A2X34_09700 [Elusimicrobia bacterium GWC2_51_8]|nr:MAG: hypothetical protein A2X33_10150 [Elusimicrobia bacterium GWA2_51_34]OGR61138.1 MAG: hypothetical protein A2X34_09700 [Elusimicrobia bacterium GWC2_51_8]OGR84724.1 MAG: hypothetical protein A2021_03865 [Elusimicrobia bacterium GWF2_52_66]